MTAVAASCPQRAPAFLSSAPGAPLGPHYCLINDTHSSFRDTDVQAAEMKPKRPPACGVNRRASSVWVAEQDATNE